MSSPLPIEDRAHDNLRFIRSTMERASSFTAVPGWGGIAMGVSSLAAAHFASAQASNDAWLRIWMLELVAALILGGIAMTLKAKRANVSLFGGPASRFAMSFGPAVLAGGMLTWALASRDQHALLPAVWLLLYGSGVIAGGLSSVRVVPVMGALFFILGIVALFGVLPADVVLAAGFGGLHIIFGSLIVWRYGG